MTVIKQLEIPGPPQTGTFPVASAYSAASNNVYIVSNGPGGYFADYPGSIVRVDLATFTVAATAYMNFRPLSVAATLDGSRVLVTGAQNGTQIFDGKTLPSTGHIAGDLQQGIVVGPR